MTVKSSTARLFTTLMRFTAALIALSVTTPSFGASPVADSKAQSLTYEILRTEDHDTAMFTQGLLLQKKAQQEAQKGTQEEMQGEILVESAGGYGSSRIRRYRAGSGEIIAEKAFPPTVFAEGVAQIGEQLYVLSWRSGICYVLDSQTLSLRDSYRYRGEGWGLTFDGEHLIMSNGSHYLVRRDPTNFAELNRVAVSDSSRRWTRLNELEYAHDRVWANVWQDARILAISPNSGRVDGILDLSELVAQNSQRNGQDVLNGIAYDAQRDAFWITGKLWPKRYFIKIHWPESAARAD